MGIGTFHIRSKKIRFTLMFRIRKIKITSEHMSIWIQLTHCLVVFWIAEFTCSFGDGFSVFKIELYLGLEEPMLFPVLAVVDFFQRLSMCAVIYVFLFVWESSAYFFIIYFYLSKYCAQKLKTDWNEDANHEIEKFQEILILVDGHLKFTPPGQAFP